MGGDVNQTPSSEERIREFVLKHFPFARKKGLNLRDKWLEIGIIDSLGILDLVHFLEEEFRITISDDELLPENFDSLGSVVAFTQKKTSATRQHQELPCN